MHSKLSHFQLYSAGHRWGGCEKVSLSPNPLAQNVSALRRAPRRIARCGRAWLFFPRLAGQPLSVCWSTMRYLAAPPIAAEKPWKPQPVISKYLGVPKHCLHFGYKESNQGLLRKVHKHFGAASRAACQSCKKVRAMSKVSRCKRRFHQP